MSDQAIITELRRVQYLLVIMIVLFCGKIVFGNDNQLAENDRQQYPPELWPQLYYLTTSPNDLQSQEALETALSLIVPSTSRQVVLERCLPVKVAPTLYRINLLDLGWDTSAWRKVVAENPYSVSDNALVLRADWLLLQLADAQESEAYYSLLFGKAKTRDEVFQLLGVDDNVANRFGLIEGQSGVNVQGKRWIENRALPRGYAWLTRDSIKLTGERDMLERPDGSFLHDGEEGIIGIRKVHLATGTQGALQVYFLADGKGKLVNRAPVDLVTDSTGFRGLPEIRCPGSCVQCHEAGLNPLTTNELRDYIASGVDAYADYENQQAIESFHFADLTRELKRDGQDFQAIVRLATGMEAKEAVSRFRSALAKYDQPLSLEQVASELHAPADELRLALAWASSKNFHLPARVAGLAHGQNIPRTSWEENYLTCRQLYADWSERK